MGKRNRREETVGVQDAKTYWRLIKYLFPVWHYFALAIIGFALFGFSQAKLAAMIEDMLGAIRSMDETDRWVLPLMIAGMVGVRIVGNVMGNYFLATVSNKVSHNMRTEVFEKLMVLPVAFYDNNSIGHIITKSVGVVGQVIIAITSALKVFLREGLFAIALIFYLFYLNWKLTFLFLTVGPIIFGVVRIMMKKFKKYSKRNIETQGQLTHVVNEAVRGQQQIKIYQAGEHEVGRFRSASLKNIKTNLKIVLNGAIMESVVAFFSTLAMVLIFVMAFNPIFMEDTTPEAFVAYLVICGLIPKPLRQISDNLSKLVQGVVAGEAMFSILDDEEEKDTGTKPLGNVKGELEFRNLTFTYPNTEDAVIKSMNLTVPAGTSVAFVGKSGSGKTTLASLVPRFYQDWQGELLLDGEEIRNFPLADIRHNISIVSQNVVMFNDNLRNNIAYGCLKDKSESEIMQAAEAAHVMEFANDLPKGFDTMLGDDATVLSGGQRQRIAIARALLKDSPILILDEATSALDNESEQQIQGALDEITKGRTTIVIAHRLSTVENCDLIVVLDHGEIVEKGSHQELLAADGAYAHLYHNQPE